MSSYKTLTIAAALSSLIFAMPASTQAMPQAVPEKIAAASYGNLVQVHYRRYCRNGRCYPRYHRHREYLPSFYRCPPFYGYYLPQYGADRPCKNYLRPDYRSYSYSGHYRRSWLFD